MTVTCGRCDSPLSAQNWVQREPLRYVCIPRERKYWRQKANKRRLSNPQKHAIKGREYQRKLKLEVLGKYSPAITRVPTCARCGNNDIRVLTLDHIYGKGTMHRKQVGNGSKFYCWIKRNKFPAGFQVLCHNCNWIKRYENNEFSHIYSL